MYIINIKCLQPVVFSVQANSRLAKRGGHTVAITPRHYLDFINQYANLFNEKRSELEEQQMHLNVGLRKIKETVDQVKSKRSLKSLTVYIVWKNPCLIVFLLLCQGGGASSGSENQESGIRSKECCCQ